MPSTFARFSRKLPACLLQNSEKAGSNTYNSYNPGPIDLDFLTKQGFVLSEYKKLIYKKISDNFNYNIYLANTLSENEMKDNILFDINNVLNINLSHITNMKIKIKYIIL
jgi:hypothetical protein